MTVLAGSLKDDASSIRAAPRVWVVAAQAGSRIGLLAGGAGAGAAVFAWAQADPYEQLSDAYTFMEGRKIRPDVGDHLYSTLRRPILTVTCADPGHCVDLLRHDHWHPRSLCLDVLQAEARNRSLRSPLRNDWPYAVNIFARTDVSAGGTLADAALSVPEGSRVELTARFDVVVAVLAAVHATTLLQLDGATV
jgi:uncharacterized protein YcgI (DUF1989 family)